MSTVSVRFTEIRPGDAFTSKLSGTMPIKWFVLGVSGQDVWYLEDTNGILKVRTFRHHGVVRFFLENVDRL